MKLLFLAIIQVILAFLVEGQHFGYDYDAIGNRTAAYLGGDRRDSNLRTQSYTLNSLNQYTTIGDTGYRDIIGSALATNNVTVNGTNASRKLEYFRKEIGVANSSGPIWQSVMVSSGGSNYTAGLAVPGLSQNLSYDEDGNLIFDGIWSYSWDGENRLASMLMTNLPGAPNRLRLDFTYDYLGRRVQKVVSFANGGSYTGVYTNWYLYDGWNLVATFKGRSATQNAIQDSYLWGQDLSGTMTGAGGIGGLLMVTTTNGQSFVCHDGNGNVRALVSAADKTIVARYEYGPFGQPLRTTGPQAKANPFRFSSKFTDEESGLVYYGYRYYSPYLGRWIGRDPMQEKGGMNLYGFCRNTSVNGFDTDGREFSAVGMLTTTGIGGMIGGAYNALVLNKSFLNGFASGAIGAGVAYCGGGFAANAWVRAAGGALGAGAGSISGSVMDGEQVNWGKVGLSMCCGAAITGLGNAIAAGLEELNRGYMRPELFDKLEEMTLDSALAAAGSMGDAAADALIQGWDNAEKIFSTRANQINNAGE